MYIIIVRKSTGRRELENLDIGGRIKLKCNTKVRCDGFVWLRIRSILLRVVNVLVKYRVP
jgi:hypothetical protein